MIRRSLSALSHAIDEFFAWLSVAWYVFLWLVGAVFVIEVVYHLIVNAASGGYSDY